MEIKASQVKELRERTGSGLMDCKKALTEAKGDLEQAIDIMRKSGLLKAGKKEGRVAAEGNIFLNIMDNNKQAAMVEINCETDFVAKGDDFISFGNQVLKRLLEEQPADIAQFVKLPNNESGTSIDSVRMELIAKIGENINIRRFSTYTSDSIIGAYLHSNKRIGVLVELKNGNESLAKDVAMHIAASNPVAISGDDVPTEILEKEREIFAAQAAESGKPAEIIEKMVSGKVRKYLADITLLGQAFVKNPDVTIEQLLKDDGATVVRFTRFEVGEGIEKKEENFAEEVMAQVRGG